MLTVRSLLAHWPGVPADLRRTLRDVDPRDPFALVESADLLAEVMHLDREDACELIGVDDRVYQAVHDACLDGAATRRARGSRPPRSSRHPRARTECDEELAILRRALEGPSS